MSWTTTPPIVSIHLVPTSNQNSQTNTNTPDAVTAPNTIVSVKLSPLTKKLYIGFKGAEVIPLQQILIAKGYLLTNTTLGNFGPLTRNAVKSFQCATGIICAGNEKSTGYGMVGRVTRAALNI